MGPMGEQGWENILENIYVRGERAGEANEPTWETELGYINRKLQRTVGRK